MNLPVSTARPPSVARRLLMLLLVPVSGLLLVGLLFDYLVVVVPLRAALDRSLAEVAVVIAAYVRVEPDGSVRADLPPVVAATLEQQHGAQPRFALREGVRVLAGDASLPPPSSADADQRPTFGSARLPSGGVTRVAWYRWRQDQRDFSLTVTEATGVRDNPVRPLLTAKLAMDVLQLVAIVVLVLIGVRRGLRPLAAFRDALATRSARTVEPLDEQRVPVELRALVTSLNALLARVRAAAESQQKFVADAAHQLRTPLAGMQAQLALLERDPAALPVRDRIEALHEGIRRLAHTARQLLTLARAEGSATLERDFVRVDLAALVEETVASHLDRALAKQIDLGAESVAAEVTGVEWLLRELVNNLVDNAINYTPPGGIVTLRSGVLPGGAFLEVEDNGPGIPAAERPLVMQRFRRAATAPGVGSGLGLAIVSDIVALHGASFELAAGAGGTGTRARVEFRGAATD